MSKKTEKEINIFSTYMSIMKSKYGFDLAAISRQSGTSIRRGSSLTNADGNLAKRSRPCAILCISFRGWDRVSLTAQLCRITSRLSAIASRYHLFFKCRVLDVAPRSPHVSHQLRSRLYHEIDRSEPYLYIPRFKTLNFFIHRVWIFADSEFRELNILCSELLICEDPDFVVQTTYMF